MKIYKTFTFGVALALGVTLTPDTKAASNVKFRTVINNGMTMPNSENKFNAGGFKSEVQHLGLVLS